MEFQLPTNLQTELLAYDPTLKKLARQEKAETSKTKKPKYPVGLPPVLIPNDVVRSSLYEGAIDDINANPAPQRFHEFRQPVGTIPDVEYITHAVIYHWEGLWVAAWLPPKGKESEYIYAYTHCYKDTASTRKMLPYGIASDSSFLRETVGRSDYLIKTVYVTKEFIQQSEKWRDRPWFMCNSYGQKGRLMGEAVRRFDKQLFASVPTWDDSNNNFERLRIGNDLFRVLFEPLAPHYVDNYFDVCQEKYQKTRDNWQLTTDTFFELIDLTGKGSCIHGLIGLIKVDTVKNILSTPFFRKWIQSQCDLATQRFNDPDNRARKSIVAPIKRIYQLADAISTINRVWPDTPIDYYQNHLDVLLGIRSLYEPESPLAKAWLREHMPVGSLFQIMTKYYTDRVTEAEASEQRRRRDWDQDIDHWLFRFHELNDTFSMLARIFDHGKTIDPPRRWRIAEFHDHVQAENWKIQNPNHALPQDLFPQPVKVDTDVLVLNQNTDDYKYKDSYDHGCSVSSMIAGHYTTRKYVFFQPIDTHQLGQWGQAVRNCVGNASNYADGVRKKNHFIVLAMIDGKPTFTIQLRINNGLMSVEQIVGFANARLTDKEKESYSEAFKKALKIREQQLTLES